MLDGATAERRFADGPDTGAPALTRHALGDGHAWYLGTRLPVAALRPLLRDVLAGAGVAAVQGIPEEVEVVRRSHADVDFVFVLNHADRAVRVPLAGTDLLTGKESTGATVLPAGDVAVLRLLRGATPAL